MVNQCEGCAYSNWENGLHYCCMTCKPTYKGPSHYIPTASLLEPMVSSDGSITAKTPVFEITYSPKVQALYVFCEQDAMFYFACLSPEERGKLGARLKRMGEEMMKWPN